MNDFRLMPLLLEKCLIKSDIVASPGFLQMGIMHLLDKLETDTDVRFYDQNKFCKKLKKSLMRSDLETCKSQQFCKNIVEVENVRMIADDLAEEILLNGIVSNDGSFRFLKYNDFLKLNVGALTRVGQFIDLSDKTNFMYLDTLCSRLLLFNRKLPIEQALLAFCVQFRGAFL